MAYRNGNNAAKTIQILFSIRIKQVLHLAAMYQKRLLVDGLMTRNHMKFLQNFHFFYIWSLKVECL